MAIPSTERKEIRIVTLAGWTDVTLLINNTVTTVIEHIPNERRAFKHAELLAELDGS